jgi:hypothetical protein
MFVGAKSTDQFIITVAAAAAATPPFFLTL